MILKFNKFFESYSNIELHYSAFDWDDNILHMPTVIHMDKLVNGKWTPTDVSTSEFANVRNDKENYRLINDNPDEAFCEFRDTGPRGKKAFLTDVKNAISGKKFGPVWDAFVKCLSDGSLFAIITARGHEPESIRESVEWIIDNILSENDKFLLYSNCLKHAYLFSHGEEFDRIPKTDNISRTPLVKLYLDECGFYGVSSKSFELEFGKASASNPEHAKELALDKFIEKCNKLGRKIGAKSVSIGFSDDDPKNVEHVNKYFKEKSALTNMLEPHKVKLNLYKTTDRNILGGERTKFHESVMGMESSVMPFSQFNNMKDRMFTNNKEYDKSMRLGSEQLAKVSKEMKSKFRKQFKNKKSTK